VTADYADDADGKVGADPKVVSAFNGTHNPQRGHLQIDGFFFDWPEVAQASQPASLSIGRYTHPQRAHACLDALRDELSILGKARFCLRKDRAVDHPTQKSASVKSA